MILQIGQKILSKIQYKNKDFQIHCLKFKLDIKSQLDTESKIAIYEVKYEKKICKSRNCYVNKIN